MHTTHHFKTRMSQRGITSDMVDMALAYGDEDPRHLDRTVLGRRHAVRLIEEKQRQVKAKERELRKEKDELRVLKKLADKGGIVVVEDNATLITTYNLEA
jgi:dTDP-4-amino-4,6-dideoxygalactose transaminase